MYYTVVVGALLPKGVAAMSLYPFLLVKTHKDRDSKVLLNHEKIHFKQQLELFVLLFYIWYFIEFIFFWIRTGSRYKAYRSICFEREAYAKEGDLSYLEKRKRFSFLNYRKVVSGKDY